MKVVAIYPGRFHPFHKGHASSFNQLAQKFGLANTYLAISAKQEQPKSPFSSQDRAKMATSLGIPSQNIIAVRNPYAAQEYIDQLNLDPEQTALIFGVSKKDMEGDPAMGIPPDPRFGFNAKKDGSPSYLQPYNKSKVDPMSQHGYIMSTDVAEFPIAGKSMRDASAIRSAYAGADEKTKMRILKDLYGDAASKMKQVFDNNLQITESIRRLISMIKPMLSEASFEQKAKFVKLLENARGIDRSRLSLYNPDGKNYRGTQNRMPTLEPDPAQDAEPLSAVDGSYDMDEIEQSIDSSQLLKLITSKMINLTPREEYIIRARFGLGGEEEQTLDQIGKAIGLSKHRVSQLESRAIWKLKQFTKPGWTPAPKKVKDPDIAAEIEQLKLQWQKIKEQEKELNDSFDEYKVPSQTMKGAYSISPMWDSKQRTLRQEKKKVNAKIKELQGKLFSLKEAKINENAGSTYTKRMANLTNDLGNGYFLGDDSYDDDDGFSKAGYSVYKQEGPDQYRLVGNVSMSPYSNPPGHIESEIKKLIASDQNVSESADYLEEK